jgi:hypothetical protein
MPLSCVRPWRCERGTELDLAAPAW